MHSRIGILSNRYIMVGRNEIIVINDEIMTVFFFLIIIIVYVPGESRVAIQPPSYVHTRTRKKRPS